jgi:hypothetical protein
MRDVVVVYVYIIKMTTMPIKWKYISNLQPSLYMSFLLGYTLEIKVEDWVYIWCLTSNFNIIVAHPSCWKSYKIVIEYMLHKIWELCYDY